MPDVKTNATLPRGESNGLAEIAGDLVRDQKRYRAVIGIVDCRRVSIDSDTGEQTATVRFRRIEVLLGEDLAAAEKLIRRALESRSGVEALPLELEDEISAAFAGLDVDELAEEAKANPGDDQRGEGGEGDEPPPPDDPPPASGGGRGGRKR